MMTEDDIAAEHARLAILAALEEELAGRSSRSLLLQHLDRLGIVRSSAWMGKQIYALAKLGAVTTDDINGTVRLAERGYEHLQRRIAIEGVARPPRPTA